jgi:uncharacterized membrane protein YfcA
MDIGLLNSANAMAMGLFQGPTATAHWHFLGGQLPQYTWDLMAQFRVLIIVAGLVVGFLIGLTGVGGGTLLTPVLVLFGVPPTVAVGTDLFYGSLTKMVGSYQHWKQGSIEWKWVLYLASGSVPFAVFATYLIHYVNVRYGTADNMVRMGLGIVLVLAAFATIINEAYRKRHALDRESKPFDLNAHKGRIILVGAVVGFLVGLTSVGSGALIAVVLIMFSGLSATTIIGTDIAHALLLVSAAALAHWQIGTVNIPLAANLLIGSLPGVVLGSRLAYYTPPRPLRFGVALLVLAGGLKMVHLF